MKVRSLPLKHNDRAGCLIAVHDYMEDIFTGMIIKYFFDVYPSISGSLPEGVKDFKPEICNRKSQTYYPILFIISMMAL
jgi:hypothetical protein